MAYDAKVVEVIIASPSDVPQERRIVREVIAEWNAVYSRHQKSVLAPIGWETHSSPELGARPQQLIIDRLLVYADILVGIFWTRVGSDTGKAISGSVEEIEEHLAAGKPVMLYFSSAPVVPDSLDRDQYQKLTEFKEWARSQGLVESFTTPEEFREKFRSQLAIMLQTNSYMKSVLAEPDAEQGLAALAPSVAATQLTPDAEAILKAAVEGGGRILSMKFMSGQLIQAGGQKFAGDGQRENARWKSALSALTSAGLVEALGFKGEVFEVTHEGYGYAERLGWQIKD